MVNWRTVTATLVALYCLKYIGRRMVPSIKPITENL